MGKGDGPVADAAASDLLTFGRLGNDVDQEVDLTLMATGVWLIMAR